MPLFRVNEKLVIAKGFDAAAALYAADAGQPAVSVTLLADDDDVVQGPVLRRVLTGTSAGKKRRLPRATKADPAAGPRRRGRLPFTAGTAKKLSKRAQRILGRGELAAAPADPPPAVAPTFSTFK